MPPIHVGETLMMTNIRNNRLVILFLLVFSLIVGINFCFGFIQVHGESMEPSIINDSIFIMDKITYKLSSLYWVITVLTVWIAASWVLLNMRRLKGE